MSAICAEYIWIDGQVPTAKLRSKMKLIEKPAQLAAIPGWSFDGSSTEQAEGHYSDCLLRPVSYYSDPIRGGDNILVLCEVDSSDGLPHASNTRHHLRKAAELHIKHQLLFGIEQEYTLYGANDRPYGWPAAGFPHPQGRYYCGVGFDEVHGRALVEAHLFACLKVGITISGINAEVMPAQWEFQLGPVSPLDVADQLWVARWLLYRIGEGSDFEAYAKLDPKPMMGDWNGAGAHTNFSTALMRAPGGIEHIKQACERLGERHREHVVVYGADNDKRLTGKHETCSIDQFRWGVGDRGASVRIPAPVNTAGCGYLEDRRPAANMDPYKVCTALIETICGLGFDPASHGWVHKKFNYT